MIGLSAEATRLATWSKRALRKPLQKIRTVDFELTVVEFMLATAARIAHSRSLTAPVKNKKNLRALSPALGAQEREDAESLRLNVLAVLNVSFRLRDSDKIAPPSLS